LAALAFFIIVLDLFDLGIYTCGKKQAANGKPVYVGEWNNKSRMWDMTERGNNYAKQ
jgi:hypothetical protein